MLQILEKYGSTLLYYHSEITKVINPVKTSRHASNMRAIASGLKTPYNLLLLWATNLTTT
jgi:hypothetical protein